jgi:beta-galactosidase
MGLVSHDRSIKKDAFYWYKAKWSEEPVLHNTERRFVKREFKEIDLRVY